MYFFASPIDNIPYNVYNNNVTYIILYVVEEEYNMSEYFNIQKFQEYMEEKLVLFNKLGSITGKMDKIEKRGIQDMAMMAYRSFIIVLFFFLICASISGMVYLLGNKMQQPLSGIVEFFYELLIKAKEFLMVGTSNLKLLASFLVGYYFTVVLPLRFFSNKDKRAIKEFQADKDKINVLIKDYYDKYENPPLPYFYCCPDTIQKILDTMEKKNLSSSEVIALSELKTT